MRCIRCGNEIEVGLKRCPYCQIEIRNESLKNRNGNIGAILGIIGLILSCIALGMIPSIVGLVYSIKGIKNKDQKQGSAVTGLVTSLMGIMTGVITIIGVVWILVDENGISTRNTASVTDTEMAAEEEISLREDEAMSEKGHTSSVEEKEENIYEADETEAWEVTDETNNDGSTSYKENGSGGYPGEEDTYGYYEEVYLGEKEAFDEDEVNLVDGTERDSIYSPMYLKAYLEAYGIKAYEADIETKIEKLISKSQEIQHVKVQSKLFKEDYYAITGGEGDYYYIGDTKDNKPDGFGILLEPVTVEVAESSSGWAKYEMTINPSYYGREDCVYKMLYAGEFEDGRFDGKGEQYCSWKEASDWGVTMTMIPLSEEAYELCGKDPQKLLNYLVRPVIYTGKFKDGKYDGNGTKIFYGVDFLSDISEPQILYVITGEFEDGLENGTIKEYVMGCLSYAGKEKDGMYHGKGKTYYHDSDQIMYKGNFREGKYHGKGTLYNSDGSVKYKGKWKDGDYAN